MRSHAAQFIVRATLSNGLPLAYSVASLRTADFVVDGLRKGGSLHPARMESTLLGIGAYVGEVLVRHAAAVWTDFGESERVQYGHPVGIRLPNGRVWSPLSAVAARYASPTADSLQAFYLSLGAVGSLARYSEDVVTCITTPVD